MLLCAVFSKGLMQVFNEISELQSKLAECRVKGLQVGLVPTMGALHNGHASLVRRSVAENDVTVVSVFLNPTQFNDPKDLERYPRTLEADCKLLEECGAQMVDGSRVLIYLNCSISKSCSGLAFPAIKTYFEARAFSAITGIA